MQAFLKDLTETGNCARKVSGTQGYIFLVLNKNFTEPYLGPLHRSSTFNFLSVKSLQEFFSLEQYQYVKGFQRFHTGVKLRCAPVFPSNFYVLSIYIMTYNNRFVFQTKE